MTPTETWNSPWTKLSAYLPASPPTCLSPIPWVKKLNHNHHIIVVFITITIASSSFLSSLRSSLCHRHHTPTVFQPSRRLPLSQSVSLLLIATVLPRVFPLSPPLPITFLLFFNLFQSVTLNLFPSPTPVIVTLSNKLSFISTYKD